MLRNFSFTKLGFDSIVNMKKTVKEGTKHKFDIVSERCRGLVKYLSNRNQTNS